MDKIVFAQLVVGNHVKVTRARMAYNRDAVGLVGEVTEVGLNDFDGSPLIGVKLPVRFKGFFTAEELEFVP